MESIIQAMPEVQAIIDRIKATVHEIDPDATVILYGSRARGDQDKQSDFDLLILIDKEKITREDQKRIKYPLYEIEFETGIIISPMVFSRKEWERIHRKTPFYENVSREGQVL